MTMTTADEEMHEVMERRIAHANKVIQNHEQFITPTTITFMGSDNEKNMNISTKMRDLFQEILKILGKNTSQTFAYSDQNSCHTTANRPKAVFSVKISGQRSCRPAISSLYFLSCTYLGQITLRSTLLSRFSIALNSS